MYLQLALLICCLNLGFAQDLPDFSNLNLNDIQSQLPAEFGQTNLTLDDLKSILRNKCIEAANGDTELGTKNYADIESSSLGLYECISSIVNYTQIQEEIEKAKPRGELDAVFHKYCGKRPDALTCAEKFNTKLVTCLDEDERSNKDMLMRIVTRLLNFVCHKEGDQIALFIAEKGPECISSKKDEIQNCLNTTASSYMSEWGFDATKVPKLIMGQKQCEDLHQMETCIVQHLEKCSEITPANLVESMFRFIRNETVCLSVNSKMTNGAGVLNISLLLVFVLINYLA